jgi:hypothetical protein
VQSPSELTRPRPGAEVGFQVAFLLVVPLNFEFVVALLLLVLFDLGFERRKLIERLVCRSAEFLRLLCDDYGVKSGRRFSAFEFFSELGFQAGIDWMGE